MQAQRYLDFAVVAGSADRLVDPEMVVGWGILLGVVDSCGWVAERSGN